MLRRFSRLVVCNFSFKKLSYSQPILVNTKRITTSQLCTPIVYGFSSLPKHQVLNVYIFAHLDACSIAYYVRGKSCQME